MLSVLHLLKRLHWTVHCKLHPFTSRPLMPSIITDDLMMMIHRNVQSLFIIYLHKAWPDLDPFSLTLKSRDLCPTVPRSFQPKWVTMKNATNVSLGENEKQKPLSDLHIIVCVNRRKMEVLCITTRLLKQDKQHVHRSLPVRSENALVECHLRVNSICSEFFLLLLPI